MSDVRDRVFGPCQTCLRPICQCPAKHTPTSDTQAMTQWIDPKEWQNREGYGEAEAMWKRLKGFPPDFPVSLQSEFQPIDKLRVELLTFSAAQRETIRRLEVERDEAWAHHRGHCRIAEAYNEEMKTLQARLSESEKAAYDVNNTIEHLQARLTASEAKGLTNDMIDSIGRNLNSRCDNGCGTAARELICQALVQGPLTPGEE
jgi:hypothetical protein